MIRLLVDGDLGVYQLASKGVFLLGRGYDPRASIGVFLVGRSGKNGKRGR